MIRAVLIGFICAFFFASASATAQSPASNQPATVFKTTTELVVLDVVATDVHRDPVHHLTAADFTILENGMPQTIKVFEEHVAGAPAPMASMPKLKPGMFTNFTHAPTSSAADVLLLDMLNTPLQAQSVVRSEALKFLQEMQPGTQLAIFTLTSKLSLVQGFTADAAVLRAQLEGVKGNPSDPRLMDDPEVGGDGPFPALPQDAGVIPGGSGALNRMQALAEIKSQTLEVRARITLDAMNQLSRYLSNIPARKNLIWFSASFPITILPDASAAPIDPFQIELSTQDLFRKTVDLMARSRVAVYPVSAYGLVTPPITPAPLQMDAAIRSQVQIKADSEAATMYQMAEATGGRAFVNTNGLKDAVEEAIRDGSNYYTIAYAPTAHNWNGEYRKIEVKLDRPKVTLDYRRGYYAGDAAAPVKQDKQSSNANAVAAPYNALRSAMLHGGPEPSQIVLVADVRPSVPDAEPAVASGNDAANGIAGPFRRFTITFLTTPGEVNCSATPDGVHHCALDFLTYVYDADGNRVNRQANVLDFDVPADRYAWLRSQNFSYSQQISVPAKGEYFLRMGMRDTSNDRIGAVELPVADIANLPALSAEASGPTAATPAK